MKISQEHIPYTYKESKRIFENKLPIKEAAENIHKNCGINYNSCADYANYFRYLMSGKGSCRSLSSFTQEYYIQQIFKDYDKAQQKITLNAFMVLIEKFEKQTTVGKKSMRSIHEKYSKII